MSWPPYTPLLILFVVGACSVLSCSRAAPLDGESRPPKVEAQTDGTLAPERRSSKPTTASATRFLALGDSYTIGEGVSPAERWPVQLADLLRAAGVELDDPQIIATTGWTTDELADAVDQAAPKGPYQLVTLLIGVNNQYRGRTAEAFAPEFRALLARAVALGGDQPSRVIVVSIPDWGVTPFAEGGDRAQIAREIDAFNAVCRDEAARAGAAFIDITPGSREAGADRSLLAPDGLHPSGTMYRRWAEQAFPAAREALASGNAD